MRWKSAAAGALGAFVMGCASTPPPAPPARPAELFGWSANGLVGETSIVIDLRRQRAEVYIGGQLAGWTAVATGKEGFNTRAGDYTVLEKVVDKYSTLYGKTVTADGSTFKADADVRKDRPPPGGSFVFAPMPYWMRLTWRGIGMHAGPIPHPGSPASHGCIRLPADFAPQLFDVVHLGTPVRILR